MVSCGGGGMNRDIPKESKAFPRTRNVHKKRQLRVKKITARTSIAARGLSKKKVRLLNKRKGGTAATGAEKMET
jgi:hypothetical protein